MRACVDDWDHPGARGTVGARNERSPLARRSRAEIRTAWSNQQKARTTAAPDDPAFQRVVKMKPAGAAKPTPAKNTQSRAVLLQPKDPAPHPPPRTPTTATRCSGNSGNSGRNQRGSSGTKGPYWEEDRQKGLDPGGIYHLLHRGGGTGAVRAPVLGHGDSGVSDAGP